MEKIWLLLFASGQIVQAKIVQWDEERDLALLRIVGAQEPPNISNPSTVAPGHPRSSPLTAPPGHFAFSCTSISPSPPKSNARLLCIGHPGSEDLETSLLGVETGYDVLHISNGRFRGYAKGQDRQDNSEIGALMHDCWTYWGHSGAPLVGVESGGLVGLHSSWDDETGMRRGVGWEALRDFLANTDGEALL